MTRLPVAHRSRISNRVAAFCLIAVSLSASAHEAKQTIPDPGFRPQSAYTPAFLEAVDTATIAVYPTIVRRADRTAHSFASQDQIISLMGQESITVAVRGNRRIDLGRLQGSSQWEVFESDMQRIAEGLQNLGPDSKYRLVMEFLLPVSNQQIFGVHCYVLDQQGHNAFSFLLNSHHQLFVDADLMAENSSEEARSDMMKRATQVGVRALKQQIERARKIQAGLIFDESPIDDTSSIMTFTESDLGEGFVAAKTLRLMCESARITLVKGYEYFVIDEPREETDARMQFKISFFEEPPPGLPVINLDQAPDQEMGPGSGVMVAREWAQVCGELQGRPLERHPQQ